MRFCDPKAVLRMTHILVLDMKVQILTRDDPLTDEAVHTILICPCMNCSITALHESLVCQQVLPPASIAPSSIWATAATLRCIARFTMSGHT